MLNPMGEGDDDVELNWFLDRNLHVGLLLVDEMHGALPELRLDGFIEDDAPELPHTQASAPFNTVGQMPSCSDAR